MSALVGTGTLVRLILRRERLALPLWLLFLTLLVVGSAFGLGRLYATPEARATFAQAINQTPAEVALLGYIYTPSLGGLTAWRVGMTGGLLAALMSILTVVRHTRGEEAAGRREWLGSAAVGRLAPLTAALLVAFFANLLLAALVTLGLSALGLNVLSSLALGASLGACGLLFAGVAGVGAQLSVAASGATLFAAGVLAVCYALRAAGDASSVSGAGAPWLAQLSPLAWTRLTRPFAGEAWGVFVWLALAAALVAAAAYLWAARRDLGAGLFAYRLGPSTAAPSLRTPLALAWRLQRGQLLTWTLGFAILGVLLGGVAPAATAQLGIGMVSTLLTPGTAGSPVDAFFTLVMMVFAGELLAVYPLQAALRLRSEELSGRADPVLSSRVRRTSWALSHLLFALLGPALILTAFGLGAGVTYGPSSGQGFLETGRLLVAALAYLPAAWIFAGVVAALFGWQPRWVGSSWAVLGLVLLLDLARELQFLGTGLTGLSPFAHIPKTLLGEGGGAPPGPLLGLVGVTALMLGVGLLGWRRRDVS